MREILFRGKCRNTGEWKEGQYINAKTHRIHNNFIAISNKEIQSVWYEVVPDTVGQYTGLTDRNGKKIFEGDIVKDMHRYSTHLAYAERGIEKRETAETYRDKGEIAAVEFCTEDVASCGCCYPAFIGSGFVASGVDLTDCEIIGNIYDNPELLNKE